MYTYHYLNRILRVSLQRTLDLQGFIQWRGWGGEASLPKHPGSLPKGRGKKRERREKGRAREIMMVGERRAWYCDNKIG
jgi:hypothetical protein